MGNLEALQWRPGESGGKYKKNWHVLGKFADGAQKKTPPSIYGDLTTMISTTIISSKL